MSYARFLLFSLCFIAHFPCGLLVFNIINSSEQKVDPLKVSQSQALIALAVLSGLPEKACDRWKITTYSLAQMLFLAGAMLIIKDLCICRLILP